MLSIRMVFQPPEIDFDGGLSSILHPPIAEYMNQEKVGENL
jgi:hypothetical protein